MRLLLLATAFVMIAGCAARPAPLGDGVEEFDRGRSWRMDGCESMYSFAVLPADAVGAHPPPSWGPGPTPLTEIHLNVHRCEVVALGLYERQAVTIAIETHDNREPPLGCRGNYTSSEIVTQWFVDDVELVGAFQNFGLPSGHATFEWQQSGDRRVVTITPDGAGPTVIEETLAGQETGSTTAQTWRRFWVNPVGGISFIDFSTETSNTELASSPLVTGDIGAPFLFAKTGLPYVGYGGMLKEDVQASVSIFGDLQCEQPVPF